MRLSNGSDSLNFSMRGSVAPVNLPPHSFFCSPLLAAFAGGASCTAPGAACTDDQLWWFLPKVYAINNSKNILGRSAVC